MVGLTKAERGLEIIEDLSKSGRIKDKEAFKRQEIQYLLNNAVKLELTQTDIERLGQELSGAEV